MMTLEKFEEATEVVKKVINRTKLVYSEYFSSTSGNKVYLKPENMQYTGAYKVRGAYYKISTLCSLLYCIPSLLSCQPGLLRLLIIQAAFAQASPSSPVHSRGLEP